MLFVGSKRRQEILRILFCKSRADTTLLLVIFRLFVQDMSPHDDSDLSVPNIRPFDKVCLQILGTKVQFIPRNPQVPFQHIEFLPDASLIGYFLQ